MTMESILVPEHSIRKPPKFSSPPSDVDLAYYADPLWCSQVWADASTYKKLCIKCIYVSYQPTPPSNVVHIR